MHEQYKDEAIEEMIRISAQPFLFKIFHFGKHKGRKIDEVILVDRPYLEWLLEQKLANPSAALTEEDWIFTLKHYLKITS